MGIPLVWFRWNSSTAISQMSSVLAVDRRSLACRSKEKQPVIPYPDRHRGAQSCSLRTRTCAFAQRHEGGHFILAVQVPGRSSGVADAFHRRHRVIAPHAGAVLSVCEPVEHNAVPAQQPEQKIYVEPGQFSDV